MSPLTDHEAVLDAFRADASVDAGRQFLELIVRYLDQTSRGDAPVSTRLSAEEVASHFAEPLPAGVQPLPLVLDRIERDVLTDATRLMHPMCMGHQVSAPLPATIWTDALISAVNGSASVREMSPSANAIEHQIVRWLGDLAGYGPTSGGTLTSGGTEATFTALLAARAKACPDAWEQGVGANPPVVVYGEQAHYAVTRAIAEMGLGLRAGISVPVRQHHLDTDALRLTLDRLAAERQSVMAVVATAGSTSVGAFDDLETVGAECARRNLWFHVDGAHGASALLSARHRHRLGGLARADSIAWDPHKMMLLPLTAGLLLVRRERDLDATFAQRAPYLFHAQESERGWDQGVRSFLCSRRTDAIKVWVALERYGADGIGHLYDRLCDLTQALHARLVEHPDFEPLHAPESNIQCFRYVGAWSARDIDSFNFDLRQAYNRSGEGWITTTVVDGQRALRTTIMNPLTTEGHLDQLLDGLRRTAERLA